MALGMPTGQGATFYDPFYRVNINTSTLEDNNLRYFDDFSVFNYLHLPKPQSLSINSPRVSQDASQSEVKSFSPRSGSHEMVCEPVPKLSTPPVRTAMDEKYANLPDSGKENHRAPENTQKNVA